MAAADAGGAGDDRSPLVTAFSWGRIEVSGRTFKDVRLYPGGAEAWDWGKTGTRHDPGIQLADVEDLLVHRPRTVVLSRGMELALKVPQATIDAIRARGPEVIVLQSEQAVAAYNARCGRETVVALIHSTC